MCDELPERSNEIFNKLEFVMVHIWRQMQERFAWAHSVKLNGVSVRDQSVFLSVKEEAWALSLSNQVNVAEAFVDDDREETCPTK